MVVGTGTVGLGLVVGSLIGGAVAKCRARGGAGGCRASMGADRSRFWLCQQLRLLYVHATGVPMAYDCGEHRGPNDVAFHQGQRQRPSSWLLQSNYAELLFVTWGSQSTSAASATGDGLLTAAEPAPARRRTWQPDAVPGLLPALPSVEASVATDCGWGRRFPVR